MLFDSFLLLLGFLSLSLLGYHLTNKWNQSASTVWLILVSLFFYASFGVNYLYLVVGSILFNYVVGWGITALPNRRAILIFGIVINVTVLGYFKYANFFLGSIAGNSA